MGSIWCLVHVHRRHEDNSGAVISRLVTKTGVDILSIHFIFQLRSKGRFYPKLRDVSDMFRTSNALTWPEQSFKEISMWKTTAYNYILREWFLNIFLKKNKNCCMSRWSHVARLGVTLPHSLISVFLDINWTRSGVLNTEAKYWILMVLWTSLRKMWMKPN